MFKKLILTSIQRFSLYFISKRIVVSRNFPAGIFVKASLVNGKKYITIAVTNYALKDKTNTAIIYHVPAHNVVGLKKSITPFAKWWCIKFNKPLPTHKIIKLKN